MFTNRSASNCEQVIANLLYTRANSSPLPSVWQEMNSSLWAATSNKKLSYRRETARQLHTSFSAHSLILHFTEHRICFTTRIDTISQKTVRHTHFKLNRAFKVIQGHPYWCRQESTMVCCRNVQLIPTLFLKLTDICQRENGKFVDFNDLTQV